jgi:hypothetical protein
MSRLVDAFERSPPREGPPLQAVHVAQNGSSYFLVHRAPPRAHQEF